MGILVAMYFFEADCQEKGLNVPWGDVISIESMVW